MADYSYRAIKEPVIDLGRTNSRSGWRDWIKGAWQVMTNRYEQSPPATKTFLTNVSIGVTILFLAGSGAMVLSHGSRIDKIEQHQTDTDNATALALQRINENLNYIRSRMDSGGNHGNGSP